jgi:hypothetical protein
MGCCGQKRQRLEPGGHAQGVMLEYQERRAVEVRGAATGRSYVFSPAQPGSGTSLSSRQPAPESQVSGSSRGRRATASANGAATQTLRQ